MARSRRVNSGAERRVRYAVDGNTVRKTQAIPQERPERSRTHRTKSGRRTKVPVVSRGYVMFLAAVSVAALLICVWYLQLKAQVTTQLEEIAASESKLSQLKADNDALYNSVLASVDLESVKEKAMNELEMKYPGEDQIYRFNTTGNSYVRQYRDVPSAE